MPPAAAPKAKRRPNRPPRRPQAGAGVAPVELIPRLELRQSFAQLPTGASLHVTTTEIDIQFLNRLLLRYEGKLAVASTPMGQVSGFGDAQFSAIGMLGASPRFVAVVIGGVILDSASQPAARPGQEAAGLRGRRRDEAVSLVVALRPRAGTGVGRRRQRAARHQSAGRARGQHRVRPRLRVVEAGPRHGRRLRAQRRKLLRAARSGPAARRPRRACSCAAARSCSEPARSTTPWRSASATCSASRSGDRDRHRSSGARCAQPICCRASTSR